MEARLTQANICRQHDQLEFFFSKKDAHQNFWWAFLLFHFYMLFS